MIGICELELDNLTLRQLQQESARALATFNATSDNLSKFNKMAHHDSQNWYKAILKDYIEKYGNLPSKIGPGKEIQLLLDK